MGGLEVFTIPEAAGTGFEDLTAANYGGSAYAVQANTHLNITGSGILVALVSSGSTTYAVQIDGGAVQFNVVTYSVSMLMIPFKQSCLVTCSAAKSGNKGAVALLD